MVIDAYARPMARTAAADREGHAARRRILDAVQEVVAERGFGCASLDLIARRAGMSRAGVLHHFPTKSAMLTTLLDSREEQLDVPCPSGTRCPARCADDPAEREPVSRELARLAHRITAEAADERHPGHEWVVRRHRRVRSRVAFGLSAARARGDVAGDVDPQQLAAVCLAVVEGLRAQWLADPEVDQDGALRTFEEILHRALLPSRDGTPAPAGG